MKAIELVAVIMCGIALFYLGAYLSFEFADTLTWASTPTKALGGIVSGSGVVVLVVYLITRND